MSAFFISGVAKGLRFSAHTGAYFGVSEDWDEKGSVLDAVLMEKAFN